MNPSFHPSPLTILRATVLGTVLFVSNIPAQEAAPNPKDLASRLSAALQDGSSKVLLKLEKKASGGGGDIKLQLRILARRTQAATEIIYQVLYPKDRKGESFLLRKPSGQAANGMLFTPPDSLSPITSSQMQDGIFGSDLSYADLVENFFSWSGQEIVGTETVDRIPCQILESKPGKGDHSSYARVRSWIDTKRLVPMRVEKYFASGKLARRIDTTRVAEDDTDRRLPASLIVRRPGQETVTEIEGSRSQHDVIYKDADFMPEALRSLNTTTGSQPK